jgi:hypothetical protein
VWRNGARHVIALDVGHSQLHWKVRSDPRVTVIENTNARHLKPGGLPDVGAAITRISIDVSFISLRHIFPVLPALVARPTEIVALVKPQFEAGRKDVGKGGLVTDADVHARVIEEVSAAAADRIEASRADRFADYRRPWQYRIPDASAMRVGIAVKPKLIEARATLAQLSDWLRQRRVDAIWTTEAAMLSDGAELTVADRAELPAQVDLDVVLGGDGTLLAMAKAIAESGRDIPILAVNFGSLGFLTEITRPEIFTALEAAINGQATHDLRMMLRATATRQGQLPLSHMALNDVVFTRTALSRMIELSVSVGDQFVTTVKADGDRAADGIHRPGHSGALGDADRAAHADQPPDRHSHRARGPRAVNELECRR